MKIASRPFLYSITAACALFAVAVGAGAADKLAKKIVSTEDMGGEKRFLTHLSTDKPIYRESETMYVRGVTLNFTDHTPYPNNEGLTVTIKGPKGDQVANGSASITGGVIGFAWPIPEGTPGGQYKVIISSPWGGLPPAERAFEVRAYRPPRLNTQIVFKRKGFGPGDTVTATVKVERAEGGIPFGAKTTITARVDGLQIHTSTTKVDASGYANAKFTLPSSISRGEGTLAFAIEDGGVVETATKTIPILLQTVDISMYPEGGDLVAGLPSRVYVEAKTPAGKPADLEGVIVDNTGKEVATLRTEHEGRGRFQFTPNRGKRYSLKLNRPAGITKTFKLPTPKPRGAVLQNRRDVYSKSQDVELKVQTNVAGPITVTLSQKEIEVASTTLKSSSARKKAAPVKLRVPKGVDGVLVATAWDQKGNPLAERLVFREPSNRVNIEVETKDGGFVIGEEVTLRVKTTDQRGKPVAANVGLSVTNQSVLELIDKREQAPRLLPMVYLENEVRELADAHVYLDPKNKKSQIAVDLLLGTQGWRRFAMTSVPDFLRQHGDKGRRALALMIRRPPPEPMPEMAFAAPAPMMRAGKGRRVRRRGPPPPRAPKPQAVKPAAKPKPRPVPKNRPQAKVGMKKDMANRFRAPAESEARADMGMALDEAGDMEMDDRLMAKEEAAPIRNAMVYVREYAHKRPAGHKKGVRSDFTETVYWNAGVTTDRKGRAEVKFVLSDSVTSFRVAADGFTAEGALGQATKMVRAVQPYYVEPKLPLQVTSNDVIQLPVAVVNATSGSLSSTLRAWAPKGIRVTGSGARSSLRKGDREREIITLNVGRFIGDAEIKVEGKAGPYMDRVKRTLDVQPYGFPQQIASGGMLSKNGNVDINFNVPQTAIKGSVEVTAHVYPTPLANMTEALTGLMREPHGCFEQTSSTNYPLVMAQQYFTTHTGVDPELIDRSQVLLKKGYDRLKGFECKEDGYEWFGEDPGHEALSAYGLLQFTDMKEVMAVDTRMVDRTRKWLLSKRNGKGGFTSERRALHTWLVDPALHSGYITWALAESGTDGINREVKTFIGTALQSGDSYVKALGANIAALNKDRSSAKKLMDALRKKQTDEGWVEGAKTSIVGSGGQSLQIETTSLATLAWLRDKAYAGQVEKAIQWLASMAKGGRYGSTQSTVLALRAIVEYDKARSKPKAPGKLAIFVNGKRVGDAVPFDQQSQGSLTLPDISGHLRPGQMRVRIAMEGGADMPFAFTTRYSATQPDSAREGKVAIQTRLVDPQIREGEVTEANVTVRNLSKETIPNPVAIVGIPGGLEVRHDQLKELKKSGKIAAYEVIGRDVVLYWRELTAEKVVQLPLSLVAQIPGKYTGPASRAYQYYVDEFKRWAPGLKVTISPR